jgi:putative ABC transport system permease protein
LWESVAQPRFYAVLMGAFALSAVLLVLLGIYGVVSYMVSCRTREIGIRLALGARSSSIYGLILGQSMLPIFLGTVVGLLSSLALVRFLSLLLFGIKPQDPMTLVTLPICLVATAFLACYLPAHRAANLDPIKALKVE